MMDPLEEHYGYLSDRVKLERYEAAIGRVVKAGSVVMDLGCGSGLLGLIALRAGATKVLFVEESSIIEVARRTVTAAGFGNQAEFHHVNSYELSVDEPVDVVLCDHVGYLGFDYGILPLLQDARRRFLKPGGALIPSEVDLYLAPVETKDGRQRIARWNDGSVPDDFAWVRMPAANTKIGVNLAADNLLGEAVSLATLKLDSRADEFLTWTVDMSTSRDGMLDGLLGWFDCCLCDDIRTTNSPCVEDSLDRPQAFLPLDEPVAVQQGDSIRTSFMARPLEHVLAWTVELPRQGKQFSLTTFNGLLLDEEALRRSHPNRVARPNHRGRARQIILGYCDGKRTIAEIEALVCLEHPDLLPSQEATRKFIRRVLTSDTGE